MTRTHLLLLLHRLLLLMNQLLELLYLIPQVIGLRSTAQSIVLNELSLLPFVQATFLCCD